jgi:hypothetical protein
MENGKALSFGGTSGRSGSFKKGASSSYQRKERRKKQEFHKHKIKLDEEGTLDFPALKQRVIIGLDKLGQQQFSIASGYGLENWINSFNMLLDDFEEKAGSKNLPEEYFQKRIDLSSILSKPVDLSDLDAEVAKLKDEETKEYARLTLQESKQHVSEKDRKILNKEHSEVLKQLERQKNALTTLRRKQTQKAGLFKRVFSRSNISEKDINFVKNKIEDLEKKLREVNESLAELAVGKLASVSTVQTVAQERIADISARLGELEALRNERMQFRPERERVTKMMAGVISSIGLPSGKKDLTATIESDLAQENESPSVERLSGPRENSTSDSGSEFEEPEL